MGMGLGLPCCGGGEPPDEPVYIDDVPCVECNPLPSLITFENIQEYDSTGGYHEVDPGTYFALSYACAYSGVVVDGIYKTWYWIDPECKEDAGVPHYGVYVFIIADFGGGFTICSSAFYIVQYPEPFNECGPGPPSAGLSGYDVTWSGNGTFGSCDPFITGTIRVEIATSSIEPQMDVIGYG